MTQAALLAYTWPQSVVPGEPFQVYVSSKASSVTLEVARVGRRREVVETRPLTDVRWQPLPTDVDTQGARWEPTTTLTVPAHWTSGYYEILLMGEVDGERLVHRAFVVVRATPDAKKRILLVLGTNTWNAYNDIGGTNLYTGPQPTAGPKPAGRVETEAPDIYVGAGTQVSFQRPMGPGYLHRPPGFGRRVAAMHGYDPDRAAHTGYKRVHKLADWIGSAGWPEWEHPFIAWAEAEGYELDVAANADLEQVPDLLSGYALMLAVGHDEYWSAPMRRAVEAFIAAGGNAAFFTGNTCFWQVRLENDGAIMVGYKDKFEQDPVYGTDREAETTTLWSDIVVKNPENRMTGLSMIYGGYARIGRRVPSGSKGWTIHRPKHWIFEGTGLQYGDLLGAEAGVVGYECDGCRFTYRDGLPYPTYDDGTPKGFEILGSSPVQHFDPESASRPVQAGELEFLSWRAFGVRGEESMAKIRHGHAILGTYTRGGTVVSAGSTDWSHGLEQRDPRVEQVTRNILNRLAQ